MRFLCTCDCRKVKGDLEELSRKFRALAADFDELYERHVRLQGRLAKRGDLKRAEQPAETPPEGETPWQRDARLNAEILSRRGHAVSDRS